MYVWSPHGLNLSSESHLSAHKLTWIVLNGSLSLNENTAAMDATRSDAGRSPRISQVIVY